MKIENRFEVKAPIDQVWSYMLDVERVAPCMPGAQLTEVVDDKTWKGKTNVKVGPVALTFTGTVVMEERDDDAHRVKLHAKGMEQKGKGAAQASVVSQLEEIEGGTRVSIDADLTITGAVAQYGRGMLQDISQRLTGEFAKCLEANIMAEGGSDRAGQAAAEPSASAAGAATAVAEPRESPAPAPPRPKPQPVATAKPVKGFRLGLWAFWRTVVRFFKRLFGRRRA